MKTTVLFTLSNHTNILSRTNIQPRMLQWENLIFMEETSQGALFSDASYHHSGNPGNIQPPKLPQTQQTPIWILLILHSGRWCCLQSRPCISKPHCEPTDPSALREQASSAPFLMASLQFPTVCNLEVPFYHGHVRVHVCVQQSCLTAIWPPGTLNIQPSSQSQPKWTNQLPMCSYYSLRY